MRSYYKQIIKNKPTFGLDISNASVKAIELRFKGNKLSLISIGEESFLLSAYVGGVIRQPETIAEAIKKLLSRADPKKFDTKNVICSIPDDKTFLLITTIPAVPEAKIQSVLDYKVPPLVPISIENIYWDWTILAKDTDKKELTILIVGAEKETIDSYIETLKLVNLNPVVFEPSQFSALRVIRGPNYLDNKVTLYMINIGKTQTDLGLVLDGVIRYNTTIHFGVNQLEKVFGEFYSLDNNAAGEKLRDSGLAILDSTKPEEEPLKINLEKILAPLNDSLAAMMTYYVSSFNKEGTDSVENVILYGEGGDIKGIKEYINKITFAQVTPASINFKILPGPQWIEHRKIQPYIVSLGLSLVAKVGQPTEINLIPNKLRDENFKRFVVSKVMFFVKLVSLNLIMASFLFGVFAYYQYQLSIQTVNQINSKNMILNSQKYTDLGTQVNSLNTQLQNIQVASTSGLNWIPVLQDFSDSIPSGVTITNFAYNIASTNASQVGPWNVTITGTSTTRQAVLQFQDNLEASTYYTSVQLPVSVLTTLTDVDFTMTATVATVPHLSVSK